MIITQRDALRQPATENEEGAAPGEEVPEIEEMARKWNKIKPWYVVLLLYATIMLIGLIYRLCI